jgi:predicted AlkP superfamily phosphohydrolase/phosphomutase
MRSARGAALLVACGLAGACAGQHPAGPDARRRVIVLGFDGLDFELTKRLMDEGRLPNFSRAARRGGFGPLQTAIPPQSPVAWSDFITGMDSGGHGIFDFVHRDPATMVPFLSTSRVSAGRTLELGRYQIPLSSGKVELLRKGRAFWEVLERHGVSTTIVRMPANFPPSGTAGRELSGMGTPDLLGTYGEFAFYTTRPAVFEKRDIAGGKVHAVAVERGAVRAKLWGPDNPFLSEPEKLSCDFTAYVDADAPLAKIVVGPEEIILAAGEWSDWLPCEFPMIRTQSLRGMVRFYLRSVRPEFELYASPVNVDPMAPALPVSTPAGYARELARTTGRFYTQGLPEDTKARQANVLTTPEFLAQARIAGGEIVRQFPQVLDDFRTGLLFFYVGNVDQVCHVMWKALDPDHPAYDPAVDGNYRGLIESLYVGLDAIVGRAVEAAGPEGTVIVMSDHGFTSWRRSFHLNAWLKAKGYLAVRDPGLAHDPGMFGNVDWARTRAYGIGVNGLYVNLRGREAEGIVAPEERAALMEEIARALLAEIDPKTGRPAVTKAYRREQTYEDRGELGGGPDIVVGYAKGTRGSGRSAIGAVGNEIVTDNLEEWSGDHEMDHEAVPGILLTSRPLRKPAGRLRDLSQSVLAEFGIDEPVQPAKEGR